MNAIKNKIKPKAAGDLNKKEMLDRFLRVDHAGEYGAVRIYQGQIAVLGRGHLGAELQEMLAHEEHHLATFNKLLPQYRTRPTALQPLWHLAGFALGAGTALLGEKAAMACTVAVEEVIGGHYQKQIDQLGDDEAELKKTLEQFRDEELDHHDRGIAHGAEQTPGYALLKHAIQTGSRVAIWLSERI